MKKNLVILFLSTLSFFSCAQQEKKHAITITAEVRGLEEGKKFYLNKIDAAGIDSSRVQNGILQFKFTKNNNEPERLAIMTTPDSGGDSRDFSFDFWTDNTNIVIAGSKDQPQNITVTGSSIHSKFFELKKLLIPLEKTLTHSKGVERDSIQMLVKEAYLDFINKNAKSYSGIVILYYKTLDKSFSADESNELLKIFDSSLLQSSYGQNIKKYINNSDKIKLGDIAPDFTQKNINGRPVSLKDFRGKYVLLEFWSSWCGPCRTENPNLVRAYNEYKNKGFEIIGISLDVNLNRWKQTIEKDKLSWTQLSDLKNWNNEVARIYNINSIPRNFLLDPNGKIIAINLRGTKLQEKLKEVLE